MMQSQKTDIKQKIILTKWRRWIQPITNVFDGGWQLKIVKYLLLVIIFLALFGNFVANEKPIYCKIDGKTYFPVFREVLIDLGLAKWQSELFSGSWDEYDYQKKIMPPIPYSASTIDISNMRLSPPLVEGKDDSFWKKHWLGTDSLGRDVLAGMIRGCRITVLIGFGSMLLAAIIGLFFGLIAGYYGDRSLKISMGTLILMTILTISLVYCVYVLFLSNENNAGNTTVFTSIAILLVHLFLFKLGTYSLNKTNWLQKKISMPLDIILMRFIEIFKTIPALIFLLALLALLTKPTVASLIGILAILLWPSIARFSRAEMLRIREEEYIKSGKILGLSDYTIIIKHALPNAIAPILVVIAFGISSAILLEATLSFLGLGIAFDDVSWGSLLSEARKNFKAWWLALFPGLAIFLTVASFNIIGDKIQSVLKNE